MLYDLYSIFCISFIYVLYIVCYMLYGYMETHQGAPLVHMVKRMQGLRDPGCHRM